MYKCIKSITKEINYISESIVYLHLNSPHRSCGGRVDPEAYETAPRRSHISLGSPFPNTALIANIRIKVLAPHDL